MLGLSATAACEVSSIWPALALGHKDGDGPVGQRGDGDGPVGHRRGWRWACRPEEGPGALLPARFLSPRWAVSSGPWYVTGQTA